ncbi:MAG: Gfo/Idh/MocA family oxidoreductase [Woeseiaceae bacterium]|nr:Gfo/Idh/MocA family oxidoreductase [Woeseiaceae bacterium]
MTSMQPIRWGFIGTGNIAGWMAAVIATTPLASLAGVASRRMDSARAFAARHGAAAATDDWCDLLARDDIDAVYIATPTSLREEIGVAAASAGKHVLGEKPFSSLSSLERITAACREHGVAFMDATHFVHHPRFDAVLSGVAQTVGRPRTLETRFLVSLTDRSDIRYDPALEPLGALGDLGWYNMRATVEYLSEGASPREVAASIVRDAKTGVITAAEGRIDYADGAISRWQCSFLADAVDIGLDLGGPGGMVSMNNFIGEHEDGSADYTIHAGGEQPQGVRIDSARSGPAKMFEDFAGAALNPERRGRWIEASEQTQALLDAVLDAAER